MFCPLFNRNMTCKCQHVSGQTCFLAGNRMENVPCTTNDQNLQRNQTDRVVFQTVMTGGGGDWLALDGKALHFNLTCITTGLVKSTFILICLTVRC